MCSPDSFPPGVLVARTLDAAVALARASPRPVETVYVVGGGSPVVEAIARQDCHAVYLTHIGTEYECDAHVPMPPFAGYARVFQTVCVRVCSPPRSLSPAELFPPGGRRRR